MARALAFLVCVAVGAAGCGGAAPADYKWGDVTVHVRATSAAEPGFSLRVLDPEDPFAAAGTMLPTASGPNAHDGAYANARYRCVSPGLFEVDVYSCTPEDTAAMVPGCVAIEFRETGVAGLYTDANGAACEIIGGGATIDLPPPGARSVDGGLPDPALGSFHLACAHSDGTVLQLMGEFVLPLDEVILIC